MEIKPVTLEGRYVRLVPMAEDHFEQMCDAGLNENLWRFIPMMVRNREDMRQYILTALKWKNEGTALPFVTFEKSNNILVGSTRYANIDVVHHL